MGVFNLLIIKAADTYQCIVTPLINMYY